MVAITKSAAHWITTGLPLALVAPLLGLLLNLPEDGFLWLVISLLVGTPALSAIGTFGAALTVGMRRGGLLLSLLVLPLYVPSLLFGSMVVSNGASGEAVGTPLALLAAISLGSLAILPFASASVLRVNLR
jgi:heme exporter protein B